MRASFPQRRLTKKLLCPAPSSVRSSTPWILAEWAKSHRVLANLRRAVSQGLESATACLLGGMANTAVDSTWMSQLFNLVSQAPSNVNVSDLTGAVADPSASHGTSSLLDSGKKFLSMVFGGNQSSIVDAVGRTTGLRSGVVSSLMSMAAPLMMTALGRLVRNDHMNPAGLSKLLVHEGEGVRDLLPAGVAVAEHPP
jgi:OOP family OmpA-OmpF porin